MDRASRLGASLAVLAGASAVGARLWDGTFQWLMWADRDLVRSLTWPWPVMGAELSYGAGARVPGGAVHHLMGLPLALGAGPTGVYRFMLVLELAGLMVLGGWVGRREGAVAGAVAASVAALSPIAADNLATLWNPGFLPLWATLVWLAGLSAVAGARRVALIGAAAALGYGAQLHLSMGLLGVGLALGAAWVGLPGAWRAAPWAGLALCAPYLPYLAAEAARGWPNSALLLSQRQVADAVDAGRLAPANVVPLAGFLTGQGEVGVAAGVVLLGVAVWGLWGRREDPVVRAASVAVGVVLVYHLVDANIRLGMPGTGRYLQVAVPGVGLLVGIGAGEVSRRWGPAAALVGVLLLVQGWDWRQAHVARQGHPLDWRRVEAWMGALVARQGSASEVLGRTVLLTRGGDGWAWSGDDALEWFLAREGAAFPGASSPPCLAVVPSGATEGAAQALGATSTREEPLPGGARLLVYDRPGPCPSSLSDRYLLSPLEEIAWGLDEGPGGVVELGDGLTAVAFDALRRADGPAAARLWVVVRRVGRRVELHSNQLRGLAHNAGFFLPVRADRLDLVLRGEGEVRRALGPAGEGAALTPLRAELPTGRWEAGLEVSLRGRAGEVTDAVSLGTWEVP